MNIRLCLRTLVAALALVVFSLSPLAVGGRLAVALDLLTDALAMVGQHGVYCQSTRVPGKPALDIALVLEQIGDAKELLQSTIELDRS